MSEVIKGPWPDPAIPGSKSRPAVKIPGSDWATGLVQEQSAPKVASFRSLIASDQEQLWRWLHLALWDPPPAGPRALAVLERPETRIYAEDWGRPTDLGIVAVVDGTAVGACWMRVLPEGVGLASVDSVTPQLGIALEPGYRRQGYGKALAMRTLGEAWDRGHAQVSLTVHSQNPAVALYKACGFRKIDERGPYHVMLARASG
jgi:ribosomal protein S18 acetylase RimI-like enzyme